MTGKKATPPALDLPPRPPSKVEAGLAAETKATETADAATGEISDLREKAIAAMVEAGLSREFAEAAFVLTEDGATATPAEVHDAVGEAAQAAEDFGAPLCPHGCHGSSWTEIPATLDGVGCEHGTFSRRPADGK